MLQYNTYKVNINKKKTVESYNQTRLESHEAEQYIGNRTRPNAL